MRARDEVEAAYFQLLRAREELDDLRRFEDYLADEVRRLRRFVAETQAHEGEIHAQFRRRIVHTQRPLHEAITARIETCQDELARMEDRLTAAEAHVQECEQQHERLRAAG